MVLGFNPAQTNPTQTSRHKYHNTHTPRQKHPNKPNDSTNLTKKGFPDLHRESLYIISLSS